MSFRQIFNRISRLARVEFGHRPGDSYERDLRRAQELIDEARRRERGERVDDDNPSHGRTARVNVEYDEEYLAACRTLGIKPGATWEQTSSAFRARAREMHPDRVASLSEEEQRRAHRRMQELNAAYEYLERRTRR